MLSTRRLATCLSLVGLAAPAAADTVLPSNLGVNWFNAPPEADTRAGGVAEFDLGPAVPPLGTGSFHMDTDCLNPPSCSLAKAQMFNYDWASLGTPGTGLKLADVTAIGYSSWRDSATTTIGTVTVSLNLTVDFAGTGASFTTLVYEPFYNGPSWPCGPKSQPAIADGTWQTWDAFDGGKAIWWSTRTIPGLPAFTFCTSWAQIVAANPQAEILGGVGFNVGSGWNNRFYGAADKLVLGTTAGVTTYDFELNRVLRIDLRPGSTTNQVNTAARQLVPIAILGDAGYDPCAGIDPESVIVRGAPPIASRTECTDADVDGIPDLLLHFRAREFAKPTPAECADPEAVIELNAADFEGNPAVGEDFVSWQGPDCK